MGAPRRRTLSASASLPLYFFLDESACRQSSISPSASTSAFSLQHVFAATASCACGVVTGVFPPRSQVLLHTVRQPAAVPRSAAHCAPTRLCRLSWIAPPDAMGSTIDPIRAPSSTTAAGTPRHRVGTPRIGPGGGVSVLRVALRPTPPGRLCRGGKVHQCPAQCLRRKSTAL